MNRSAAFFSTPDFHGAPTPVEPPEPASRFSQYISNASSPCSKGRMLTLTFFFFSSYQDQNPRYLFFQNPVAVCNALIRPPPDPLRENSLP